MRRRIGIFMVAALLLASLMVPALAAPSGETPGIYDLKVEAGYTVTPVTKDGGAITAADGFYAKAEKLTVSVNGAKADPFYLVTAQNAKDVPKESNLVYIDQQTGPATFNVYPSAMEDGKPYYIFIASNETSGALKQIASFVYYGGKTESVGMRGDVNHDGSISATDALWVLEFVANPDSHTISTAIGDVNKDGSITATDALWILEFVANPASHDFS